MSIDRAAAAANTRAPWRHRHVRPVWLSLDCLKHVGMLKEMRRCATPTYGIRRLEVVPELIYFWNSAANVSGVPEKS
jgi:hypothetical protein